MPWGKIVPLAGFKKAAGEDPKAPDMVQQILDVGGANGFGVFMNDDKNKKPAPYWFGSMATPRRWSAFCPSAVPPRRSRKCPSRPFAEE